jgi:hypothetical protein
VVVVQRGLRAVCQLAPGAGSLPAQEEDSLPVLAAACQRVLAVAYQPALAAECLPVPAADSQLTAATGALGRPA